MKPPKFLHTLALILANVLLSQVVMAAPIVIDGNTSDWNAEDRLELPPRSPVDGFEVYGRYENSAYKVLLKRLNGTIATSTTLWLNTDQDSNTGYKIWGYAGGAEYNINIAADGKPYLYQDADGQTFISGPLNHSIVANGNGTNMELEIPENIIGSPAGSGINMLIDVNNATFLPVSYWPHENNYIIAKQTVFDAGGITIDGNKSDWNFNDRLDINASNTVEGAELYGRYEDGKYKFLLHDFIRSIGAGTTFWLNTDQNAATGHQIWGFAGGSEFNINYFTDNQPYLYTDGPGQTFVSGGIQSATTPDGNGGSITEFEIPEALIGTPTGDGINVLVDVNNDSYLPRSYWPSTNNYVLKRQQATAPLAIVYSETTEGRFFDKKAYAQLFMSVQSQAMMAGIPYDLLNEDDLLDLSKITKYKTLVFPYFANVKTSLLPGIEQNLNTAVDQYNVGLVTAGNFLTNDESGASLPGDAYSRMKSMMGITRVDGGGPFNLSYKISDDSHPITSDEYTTNEVLKEYDGIFTDYFVATGAYPSTVLATQSFNGTTKNALIVTENQGRHAHFGSVQLMTDTNILWPVLQWSVYSEKAPAALNMSRNKALFVGRNDMDQSMFLDEVEIVDGALLPILQTWKNQYDFVGSYYINIGAYPQNQEQTDWSYSGPLYQQYLALGNEMGTHSYTHPDNTNIKTNGQLEWEFAASRSIIEQQLNLTDLSGAVPGAPEDLRTSLEIIKHLNYLSGGYSGVGAGFPNAFGFLNPTQGKVYLSPNMSFDFTLVEFQNLTAAQAKQVWFNEFDALTKHTGQALVHWPWHDYGPINFDNAGYTFDMFDALLDKAYQYGSEFVTGKDFANRIKTFKTTGLEVRKQGSTITASVSAANVGKFALKVAKNTQIQSVANWYAYDDDQVFLKNGGGTYTIELGTPANNVSRITALPSRGELVNLSGDGTDLDITFKGKGDVEVTLKCAPTAFTVSGGTNRYQFVSPSKVNIQFTTDQLHAATQVDATCP
ncbi:MAG: hypothetical protein ACPG47_00845 [Leucothrix sp.]